MKNKKQKILFQSFLERPQIYGRCKSYWRKALTPVLTQKAGGELLEDIYQTYFSNGKPMRDGNPMISFWDRANKKSLRILQEKLEEGEQPNVDFWTETVEIKGQKTEELIVALVLTTENKEKALSFVRDFWNERLVV